MEFNATNANIASGISKPEIRYWKAVCGWTTRK